MRYDHYERSKNDGKDHLKRSSLLLAGGRSTRLNGREKALIVYNERAFIEHALETLDEVSDEVIVSLRNEEQLNDFAKYVNDRKFVTDTIENSGPLAGMLSGLKVACGDYVLTVACDMPFLNSELIDMMFEMAEGHDALIPINKDCTKEPLHAVYSRKKMLEAIEITLDLGQRSILAAASYMDDVLYMDIGLLKIKDKYLKSFVNINTPHDLSIIHNGKNYEDE